MKNKPIAVSDRIFVRLDLPEKGNIITLHTPQTRTIGTVESIGPLVRSVQVGDRVLFHGFDELPTYDENVVVIRERSLLGRFETAC